ncbi:hypothetical protein GCM10011297_28600 [Bacterioplanes sanyensis]|jgi:hypothetical protein|uniref:hypothetical protein n=1 Tax=Bacterioplanes sanyensis TaxID=1249553 RepID=UPI001675C00D|nr:hypothetical protein [Bacterioplanes sanyensis]GGY54044.1 hypothetical protein GCM10011297_28600 [Bacterioplanes sanyensis]
MAKKQQPDAEQRRQQIAADVQRFLEQGGHITHVDPFVSGETGWQRQSSFRPATKVQLNQRIAPGVML